METAIATSAMHKSPLTSNYNGVEKAAIFLLSLPEDYVKKIFAKLDQFEVLELSQRMATLGMIPAEVVEDLYVELANRMGSAGSIIGSYENTEKLLGKFFDPEKVRDIMSEIRGPAGRTMWEKLGNVSESVLANYIKNEYPQTAAVILSKIRPDHAAKVFALLPEQNAMDIMMRMIKMENIQREILDDVERTLKTEFMSNLAKTSQKDPHHLIAEIFNSFDRATENRFMGALEQENGESAERVKSLMFTFDDLIKLDTSGVQTVIRVADKTRLALALKGSNEAIRDMFFKNMSERAAKLMKDDMQAMGMVRLKDVDEAQLEIVTQTKELINTGEIIITVAASEEEMIE
jgi:flagellar motor switch protein FliG